ncbi:MAG TPA: hypothetical protein VJ850_09020 [Candidatus Limnocylindrales bacterium]|nr:hypothetical protein [Candidatus Limnocylindrales bacterium]
MNATTKVEHRIVEISYKRNVVVCACGASMPAREGRAWNQHRIAVGLPPKSPGAYV